MGLKAQGSKFYWDGSGPAAAVARIKQITITDSGTDIDLTDLDATESQYLCDFGDKVLTIEIFGTSDIVRGSSADEASIVWNTGKTRDLGPLVCTNSTESGAVRGAVTTSLSFKKAYVE